MVYSMLFASTFYYSSSYCFIFSYFLISYSFFSFSASFFEPRLSYLLDPIDWLLFIVEVVPVFGLLFLAVLFPLVVPLNYPACLVRFKFLDEEDVIGLFVGEEIAGLIDALGVSTLGLPAMAEEGFVDAGLVKFD